MKIKFNPRFILLVLTVTSFVVLPGSTTQRAAIQTAPLRLGMIGLDTSHVLRFTELLNDPSRPDHVPGARVVAAFKGGSPDVEDSTTRIERFTAEMKDKWKVELVGSIEELCQKVDAVLLMSVDGRQHLAQIRPVFAAKKPVFIDKPFAGNFEQAYQIVELGQKSGTPFFSSSPRRFSAEVQTLKRNQSLGDIQGAFAYGPMPIEPHVPDLFWYGIHSVESLYTLMGAGCETVTRVHTEGADVVTGRWKDGRIGVVRGDRKDKTYGAVVFGSKSVVSTKAAGDEPKTTDPNQPARSGYYGVVSTVVKFFQTKQPPVSPEETLEIMAFMQAADLSKARNGAPVALTEVWKDYGMKAKAAKQ
ncbi:MAG: Gfo/Idh/MocA family oxidoreductase [Acidobacteriota bacterium]|nr:Gfo/Idh/MocA family oxidoreductase [Acidobacteriota bacterium]